MATPNYGIDAYAQYNAGFMPDSHCIVCGTEKPDPGESTCGSHSCECAMAGVCEHCEGRVCDPDTGDVCRYVLEEEGQEQLPW